jgi:hypothetical protein
MRSSVFPAALLAIALAGCSSRPPDPQAALLVTTLSLSGTPGAAFSGYYTRGRERIEISGVLPRTIEDRGITGLEFRKARIEDTLVLEARDGKSYLNFIAGPPLPGVQADLEGGWAVGSAGSLDPGWKRAAPAIVVAGILLAGAGAWLRSRLRRRSRTGDGAPRPATGA